LAFLWRIVAEFSRSGVVRSGASRHVRIVCIQPRAKMTGPPHHQGNDLAATTFTHRLLETSRPATSGPLLVVALANVTGLGVSFHVAYVIMRGTLL
jgi:hypothetical protein